MVYSYVLGFPVTVLNIIWVVLIIFLSTLYFLIYCIPPGTSAGNVARYILNYGKSKEFHVSIMDIPKRYFTHFYIFASLWNVSCFLTMFGLCFGFIQQNWIADLFGLQANSNQNGDQISLLLVMFMIAVHSSKRLYECLFVSVFSDKGKINLIQYIWGFVFYMTLAPIMMTECLHIQDLPFGTFKLKYFIGICIFMYASYVHQQSHSILANLRKSGGVKKDAHGLPKGGVFEYVSCPHYFAEVLAYVAFLVIISEQCKSWWIVMTYNVIAHACMGMGSHTWYRETFPHYPKHRRAFIPYLW